MGLRKSKVMLAWWSGAGLGMWMWGIAACGSTAEAPAPPPAGWLAGCLTGAQCGPGLACVSGICTTPCTDDAACEALDGAVCAAIGQAERGCVRPERVGCTSSGLACDAAHEGWICDLEAAGECTQTMRLCDAGVWKAGRIDGCRDRMTVDDGEGSTVTFGARRPPIDVLFVVDNSAGMFAAQRSLANAVGPFMVALAGATGAEVRVAATTVDASCEVNGTSVTSARGSFNQVAARFAPPPGQVHYFGPCRTDLDCPAAVCEAGGRCGTADVDWACRTSTSQACVTNPNGSFNTYCRRRCTNDETCRDELGAEAFCQKPSANPSDWGCVYALPTGPCPEVTPAIVGVDDVDLAKCVVSVGVNQEKCLKFEQGFEASRLALDREGPNAAQAQAFHREGMLVVVYVTNDEDCSTHEVLREDQYSICGLLPSTDDGGPLIPVREYVSFLKAQRRAGEVLVLAISGQSLETDPEAVAADEAAYVASKSDTRTCYQQTAICQRGPNSADLGTRYAALARAFGPDGAVDNLCLVDDLAESLGRLEARIVANMGRICAPRASLAGVIVSATVGGETKVLTEGASTGYAVVADAPECEHGTAIVPNVALGAGDRVIFQLP